MTAKTARVLALALVCAFALPSTAKDNSVQTLTWWCLDLNQLLHVDLPVVISRSLIVPPADPGVPVCEGVFPMRVPTSSSSVAGGQMLWWTNKTYSPQYRAALDQMGYVSHGNSPIEDFLFKITNVRVEIRNTFGEELIAEYNFDPRANFRLFQLHQWNDPLPMDPYVDPSLGVDISAAEAGRLPTVAFPTIIPPLPPGDYRTWIYWTFSEMHCDGMGLEMYANCFPPGELFYGYARFVVTP